MLCFAQYFQSLYLLICLHLTLCCFCFLRTSSHSAHRLVSISLCCFGLLRTSTHSAHCRLVSVSLFVPLVCLTPSRSARRRLVSISLFVALLRTSSHSGRCRLVSVSIFAALVPSTRRVDLLIVNLSRLFQPFVLCVEHLDSLCLLFSCHWWLSKYSYFHRTGSCKLTKFHSPKLLSIRPFSHRFQFGFCLAAFCTFVIAFLKCLPSTQPSHSVAKGTVVDAYKYKYIHFMIEYDSI